MLYGTFYSPPQDSFGSMYEYYVWHFGCPFAVSLLALMLARHDIVWLETTVREGSRGGQSNSLRAEDACVSVTLLGRQAHCVLPFPSLARTRLTHKHLPPECPALALGRRLPAALLHPLVVVVVVEEEEERAATSTSPTSPSRRTSRS